MTPTRLPEGTVTFLLTDVESSTVAWDREPEAMAAAIPKSELLMVAGGTHVVPLERKELVSERVELFLRERVGV